MQDRSTPSRPERDVPRRKAPMGWAPSHVRRYLRKMRGTTRSSPPRVMDAEILWSWIGGFVGMSAVTWIDRLILGAGGPNLPLIGSFGASAVLVYGAPKSPLAQPRNLVGGHLISALVGVTCQQALGGMPGLAAAMAVATAIALMHFTRTLHPPGGATALIAVIGPEQIHAMGFTYCLAPVGSGATILLLVGLLVNNLPNHRRYPEFWI